MQLNEYDQKEFDKRLDDPDFSKLYNELIDLGPLHYPGLIVEYGPINASGSNGEIIPDDLDRRDLKFRRFSNDEKKAIDMLQKAQELANRMAYFFPSAKHRRWQTIFTIMAMNRGSLTWATKIGQRQAGGSPGLTENEINERLEILSDVEKTKKQKRITYNDACAQLSQKYDQYLTWDTVKKWRKYRNRPRNG